MVSVHDARADVDEYLRDLRRHLRGLQPDEADEIVKEIESHIGELLRKRGSDPKAAEDVLNRLGRPGDLASLYSASQAVARASRSTSPHHVLAAAFAWMRVSIYGVWILAIAIIGYFLAASFIAAAALKPLFPGRTGLWRSLDGDSYSLRLGLGTSLPTGQEILGWFLIPLGFIFGAVTLWAVTRYVRAAFIAEGQRLRAFLPGASSE